MANEAASRDRLAAANADASADGTMGPRQTIRVVICSTHAAARVLALSQAAVLPGRVFWHGEVDDAALQAHYAATDKLVLAAASAVGSATTAPTGATVHEG
jgi:hypothetical protein